jgi:hypothetical protein
MMHKILKTGRKVSLYENLWSDCLNRKVKCFADNTSRRGNSHHTVTTKNNSGHHIAATDGLVKNGANITDMSVVMDLTGATSARNVMFHQTNNENDHGNVYADEYENVTENDFVNMKFRYRGARGIFHTLFS